MFINLLFDAVLCYILLYSMSNVVLYPVVQLNNEVIVLLGCSTPYLQNQRVNSVLTYIETTTSPVTLYLSGGSKDGNTESEASIMQRRINKLHPNVNIYIDPESKNTVENFVNLNNWIQQTNNPVSKVIIATSDFHKERAEKIFNLIVDNIVPEWNLSTSNCDWCWDAEATHMKNIQSDIKKALRR
jgi:uncharacterized SAM-binding protein YcdF (DUF218 family)